MEDGEYLASQFEGIALRADRQSTMHACMRDCYSLWGLVLNLFTLLLSVVLLSVVWRQGNIIDLLGTKVNLQTIAAAAAVLNLSLVVVDLVWRPTAKAQAHDQAARRYLKLRYDIERMLSCDDELSLHKLNQVSQEYSDTRDLPPIANRLVLKLKRWHELKIRLSLALEENPYPSVRKLRDHLSRSVEGAAHSKALHVGGNGRRRLVSTQRGNTGDESPVLDTEAESKE